MFLVCGISAKREIESHILFIFYFSQYLFIFERERQSASGGEAKRERETQNPKQAPDSVLSAEPDVGLELTNWEIVT